MGNSKIQPHHVLKFLSVCVFAVALIAISVSFLTRSHRQGKVPEIAQELEERKIDKKERIEIRGMKRDEESWEVLADRHYIGEDNLYRNATYAIEGIYEEAHTNAKTHQCPLKNAIFVSNLDSDPNQ